MTLRGIGSRVDQALNPISGTQPQGHDWSGSWPTATELEPGSASFDPRSRGTSEFAGAEDAEALRLWIRPERNDTIPSPPPELESAPWQDER